MFVFGVLTISSSVLVGSCGNVDDNDFGGLRNNEIILGGTVVTNVDIVIDGTIISEGVCGIVKSVDEEDGVAEISILAKSIPSFLEGVEYQPSQAFSGFGDFPITSFLFLHQSTPIRRSSVRCDICSSNKTVF